MERLKSEEFKELFGGWFELFLPFIEGEEMFNIYQRLKADGQKEIIPPGSENVFKVFKLSSPEKVRGIWYLQDPYAKRYKNKEFQADGIAMSCSNAPDEKLQPSLEKFYEAMDKTLGIEVEQSKSLSYLLEQGILMLNTDLTCKLNKTASHKGLWAPFQKFFLENIMGKKTGIIYVLAGEASWTMEKYIVPVGNYIFKTSHPVSASYTHTVWDCKDVFNKTNKILKEHGKREIFWNRKEWENDCPF